MIRLGLIGLGWIGRVHAEMVHRNEECRLSAVCDANPAARETAESYGAEFFSDYEEMLNRGGLDGVIVALPTPLHASAGMRCAEAGLPVLMEKPLALTEEEGQRLIEAAERRRVPLLVGYHRRFNPKVGLVRKIVREGGLGRLVGAVVIWALFKDEGYFKPLWRREPGAGPVFNNLTHEIDTLRFVCGEIARVQAETGNEVRGFAVEDSACITLRFRSGALGSIFASDTVASPWAYELTAGENEEFPRQREDCYYFMGTEASLTFPGLKKTFYRDSPGKGWREPLACEALSVVPENPYARQLGHFCQVIEGNEEPLTSGEDALGTLRAVLAISRSGRTGQAVQL